MNVVLNYNSWWNWEDYPGQKVAFDGPNKIIYVSEGVTELSVKGDLYSAWKEWNVGSQEAPNPTAYLAAFTAIGGDPITEAQNVGDTFFLENGWRIQPFPSKTPYVLTVNGNIYTREPGENPFLFAEGVSVSLIRSNIVDLVVVEPIAATITSADIASIADAVWNETLDEHQNPGTTGQRLKKNLSKTQYIARI